MPTELIAFVAILILFLIMLWAVPLAVKRLQLQANPTFKLILKIFTLIFKILLSCIAIAFAVLFATPIFGGSLPAPFAYLLSIFSLVLAAAPWSPKAILVSFILLFFMLSIAFLFMALQEIQGLEKYPLVCSSRSAICPLSNLLYEKFGKFSVASLHIFIASFFAYYTYKYAKIKT